MFQVCIHGRSGQGVTTAADLLLQAARIEGQQVGAYATFGTPGTSAAEVSLCRLAQEPHSARVDPDYPDALIVQDPTLPDVPAQLARLQPTGWVLLNSTLSPGAMMEEFPSIRVPLSRAATVPADDIARDYLGRALPAAALVGAFVGLTHQLKLESVLQAVLTMFHSAVAAGSIRCIQAGHAWIADATHLSTDGLNERGVGHIASPERAHWAGDR